MLQILVNLTVYIMMPWHTATAPSLTEFFLPVSRTNLIHVYVVRLPLWGPNILPPPVLVALFLLTSRPDWTISGSIVKGTESQA